MNTLTKMTLMVTLGLGLAGCFSSGSEDPPPPAVEQPPTGFAADGQTYYQFNCSSCHKDVHKGEFGNNCAKCHIESDFKMPKNYHKSFKLKGIHYSLGCNE